MRYLGLDVATSTGVAILDENDLIHIEVFKLSSKDSHRVKLKKLRIKVLDILTQFNPEVVAIEQTYMGVNAKTTAFLNKMKGVVTEAIPIELKLHDVEASKAKKLVLGKGNLNKREVFDWAKEEYSLDNLNFKCDNDITDAILLAKYSKIITKG